MYHEYQPIRALCVVGCRMTIKSGMVTQIQTQDGLRVLYNTLYKKQVAPPFLCGSVFLCRSQPQQHQTVCGSAFFMWLSLFMQKSTPIALDGIKPFHNPLKKISLHQTQTLLDIIPCLGLVYASYAINAERRWMPLTKGRLGTIKEGVILFLSECDLDVERWMTVELSLHHVAGQTGAKSGQ